MKSFLLTFLMLLFNIINVLSQINLEHNYPRRVTPVHFSGAGYKYYCFITTAPWSGTINIYNLDHSLYQSINTPASIPHTMGHTGSIYLGDISDSLYNTNTSNIEYRVYWMDTINYQYHTRIFDNAGNLLFSRDSVLCYSQFTTAGYKLLCYGASTSSLAINPVYSLPGAIPCDECVDGDIITSKEPYQLNNNYRFNIFPNPSNNYTTIDYKLPDGVTLGQIVFLNMEGIEIKRFTIDNTFSNIVISTYDLPAGLYFYQLRVNNNAISSKKLIIIK